MEKHFEKFNQWLRAQQLDTVTKKTLLKEVIRRARTAETVSPWYTRISFTYIPAAAIALCAVLFISTGTGTSPVVTSPENIGVDTHEYQVLSAYEQADKIAKEKASLKKIINALPTDAVKSTVITELQSIEQYLETPDTVPAETKSETKTTPENEPVIIQEPDKITTAPEVSTENKDKISEFYQKIKTSQEKGDYAEVLILIGEAKKIIADEKNTEKTDTQTTTTEQDKIDTNKKQ